MARMVYRSDSAWPGNSAAIASYPCINPNSPAIVQPWFSQSHPARVAIWIVRRQLPCPYSSAMTPLAKFSVESLHPQYLNPCCAACSW